MDSYPQKCLLGAFDRLENNLPDFFKVENVRLVRFEQNLLFFHHQANQLEWGGGGLKNPYKTFFTMLRKIH